MKCNIYIKIGEESILIAEGIDSSLTPSEVNLDFINIIKSYKNIGLLSLKLKNRLLEGINLKQIEGEDKSEYGDTQIANSNGKKVFDSAPPQIKSLFPDMDLSKIKVRLVNKFETYGNKVIIKRSANGEEIYLLDGDPATIKKFAKHLAIENAVNNQVLEKLSPDSNEYKIIEAVLPYASKKYKEVKDKSSLLKHFIKNKSNYNKISLNYNGEIYTAQYLLNLVIPKIEHIYYPKNNNYSTPIVANVYSGMKFEKGLPTINYGDLYNILSGLVKTNMFSSLKEFNELMKSSDKPKEILNFFKLFGEEIDKNNKEENYSILFDIIFKQERGFPYRYRRTNKDGKLVFNSTYYELEKTYDLSYDTILLMESKNYKGWKIYLYKLPLKEGELNQLSEFFISQYSLLPTSKGKMFTSLEEAKAAIDKKLENLTFRSSFMLDLFLELSNIKSYNEISISKDFDSLLKGNVIKIPNIPISKNIKFLDTREALIKGNYNIEEFKNLIKGWPKDIQDILIKDGELIPEIDNILKAGIFLALLNDLYKNLERTPEIINSVILQIKEAPLVYFYVEETKNVYGKDGRVVSKKLKLTKLPENPVLDIEYKQLYGYQYPIILFWENIAETLNNIFGTEINILTLSEILDKFGNKYSTEKAFIKGNLVYINSTLGSTEDLFHEYIHIIMGYLKTNNPDAYGNLLKQVWNNTNDGDKSSINKEYKDENYISKLEENFVRLFANYIYNNGNKKFNEIFKSDSMENTFETIFDKAEFDLKEAGKHPISEIFGKLSSEISMALQKDNKLFNGFASQELFKLSNQKSNLLNKWISDGKIKEFNCK